MRLPFVSGLEIGGWCRDCTHAARRLTRFSGPGHYCSANHPKWSGWQELHLRPPRSEQGRLLLTLHPEKWLPDLDSHQDKRLNRPPCYFDTTWQNAGAAGRNRTCIDPFRRRMPHLIQPWQPLNCKRIGPCGETCTPGHSVPGRACCSYTTHGHPDQRGKSGVGNARH